MRAYEFINESELTEIERVSDTYWTEKDVEKWLDLKEVNIKDMYKLPGYDGYYYGFKSIGSESPTIIIAHNNVTVAALDLEKYFENYTVSGIGVKSAYSNKGLAKELYKLALYPPPIGLGYTVMSDSSQTPGGIRIWLSLNKMPNIKVTGILRVSNYVSDIIANDYKEEMKKINGSDIGNYDNSDIYEFPVKYFDEVKELRTSIESDLVRLYHNDTKYDITTLLMARYIG